MPLTSVSAGRSTHGPGTMGAGQKDTCPPPLKARTSPLHGDARVSGSLSVAFSFLGSLMTLRVLACLLWLG